ncbi:MAG TPA: flagellar assembly protein FliH [Marinospirillum sp.]|uniref:flagellar assembly protein FliH n=1 Tax=Marinospirillum sp. TaxID=2183934 RepID=UPI002B45DB96|nr:flagellar assembly protein FliH [Marinospirillum sp.]HKM16438.1 flagellar assembly protein FliH [Marinospirillum sp.]
MQNKKRIPVSDNVAYTHWEMPDLTGVKRRIAQRLKELKKEDDLPEEVSLVEPVIAAPTPEALIAQAEEAQQQGYAVGFAEGVAAGQEEGRALGYQEGEKTGQEVGFQSGYEQGLGQAEQEIDQQLARLQGLIEQLQGPVAALDQDVENALLSLVDLVCRAILRREVKLERNFLIDVLQESVAALPVGHQRLRIFLNPEDLNLAEAACENLLDEYRLVGDSEVTLGGARIETLQSLVDSTLEGRYKKIIDKLLGSAYRPVASNFAPLADGVLDTPDTPPLDQAVFSEPFIASTEPQANLAIAESELDTVLESPFLEKNALLQPEQELGQALALEPEQELALEPEQESEPRLQPEPIAQVSLQRGKTPRHERPKDTALEDDLVDLPMAMPVAKPMLEPLDDVVNASEVAMIASEEENISETDDFLQGFDLNDAEADLEALFSETEPRAAAVEEAAVTNEVKDSKVVELVDESVEEERWSPESIHDDRYVVENNWLDDLEDLPDNDALNVIDEQDIPHG